MFKLCDVLQAFSANSWFQGYLWRIIFCPRCGSHLGWWVKPAMS